MSRCREHLAMTFARMSRRQFLAASAAATTWITLGPRDLLAADEPLHVELGVCAALEKHAAIKAAGFSYIESGARDILCPREPEEKFEARLRQIQAASLPIAACNGMLPADLKIVGPEVNLNAVVAYAKTLCARAKKAGVKILVMGSGKTRQVPEGFEVAKARQQFIEFGKAVGPIAGENGVTIVLENLNRGECNFINRVEEGLELLEAIGSDHFQSFGDIYHMQREDESPASFVKAGARVRHVHIAEKKDRTAPGVAGDDFRPYLKALKQIGYRGRISMECRWDKTDFDKQLAAAKKALDEQIASV